MAKNEPLILGHKSLTSGKNVALDNPFYNVLSLKRDCIGMLQSSLPAPTIHKYSSHLTGRTVCGV